MYDSDSEEDDRIQLGRMVLTYRERNSTCVEFCRYIPKLINEFFLDKDMFYRRFGMDQKEFDELHATIEDKIRYKHAVFYENIGSRERLAICLRYLASGDSMQDVGKHYGLTHRTMMIIIQEMCKTLSQHLTPRLMPPPTKKTWERTASDFMRKYSMPNCIGALEAKNVYVGGKKIILLVLVDAKDRFLMVDLCDYRMHSSRGNVIDNSCMGKIFLEKKIGVPADQPIIANSKPLPYMILASSFFPPKPYLMTKFSRAQCAVNAVNKVFNTRVTRAKVSANRALIKLKNRWGVFQNPMKVPEKLIPDVVRACCCLHNKYGLKAYNMMDDCFDESVAITEARLNELLSMVPNDTRDIRYKFTEYFLSPEGQVPWQWKNILT